MTFLPNLSNLLSAVVIVSIIILTALIVEVAIGITRPDSTNCAGDHWDYIPNWTNQGSLAEGIAWKLVARPCLHFAWDVLRGRYQLSAISHKNKQ